MAAMFAINDLLNIHLFKNISVFMIRSNLFDVILKVAVEDFLK